ncbi:amidohydrolase family protein [Nocardioides sp.]|uniref:amidohydrolase family protein n=1 Tax=Nocardioides sp. TaxID=35761 RepID=UPI00260D5684|nr:amidohydrolase family protein [Nocardioides sp.]
MSSSVSPSATVPLPPDEAALVRRRLTALGVDGLIDVHTHFMPDSVLRKVWGYFDAVGPMTGRPWPIAYRLSEAERVQRLQDFGVSHFTALNYPHKPEMAAWLNAWGREFAAATPGCLTSATFYPEASAATYVPEAIAAGAHVFKAHVQVGDYDPNDPLLNPVWGTLAEARTPVVIHCGHGPAPGTHTGPAAMRTLLARFPDLVLIVAHMGLPDYGDFLDLAARYPGVHLDTTMAFTAFTEALTPFPPDLRPMLVDLGDRILFGSDFPNIPYSYLSALDAVVDLGLGDDWTRGVVEGNARRLFHL